MSMKYTQQDTDSKNEDELREMLTDTSFLTDDADADTLLRISEALIRKENKTPEDQGAEWNAFSSRLVKQYSHKLPRGFVKSVRQRNRNIEASRTGFRMSRVLLGVMVLIVILTGGIATAGAVSPNLLQAVVSFTDDVLHKNISGNPNRSDFGSQTFQNLLDALGIDSLHPPSWLPEGYVFGTVEISAMPNRNRISAIYRNGDQMIVLTIVAYSDSPPPTLQDFEKDSGGITEYTHRNMDFDIFSNMGTMVATWVDGLNDCDIQGSVSMDEMKKIINSLYEGK